MQIPREEGHGDGHTVQGGRDMENDPGKNPMDYFKEDDGDDFVPDEIPDEVFEEIFEEANGFDEDEDRSPEDQAQDAATDDGDDKDDQDIWGDIDSEADSDSKPGPDNQLAQALQIIQMQQEALKGMTSQGGETETNQPPLRERLKQLAPKADDATLDNMAAMFKMVGDEVYGPQINQLSQAIQQLGGKITASESVQQRTEFNSSINGLMDRLKISDSEERANLRSTVIGRGWEKYGQDFRINHIPSLMREIVGSTRKTQAVREDEVLDEKEEDMEREAPVKTGKNEGTGRESIRQKIRESSNPDMDFHGDAFTRLVSNFMGAADKFNGSRPVKRRAARRR